MCRTVGSITFVFFAYLYVRRPNVPIMLWQKGGL